jgi:hypothetical protein
VVRPGILLLCAFAACSGGAAPPASPETQPEPDFLLADVNDTSVTYGTDVSPRDHVGRVSAWYFGSAT